MTYDIAQPDPLRKLQNHRSNIRIALIIGIVALVLNLIFGFSIDTFFWAIAIFQLYRWYQKSEEFIRTRSRIDLKSLRSLRSTFLVLWIVAAIASVLLWGLQPDSLLGIIVSASATYIMNQFVLEAEPLAGPHQNSETSAPAQKQAQSGSESRIAGQSVGFCGNCGATLTQDEKFCKSCGEKV
ncbi:MAG: zinc ribbon domain-containing protein [Candidatus Heimdallarchaeota archaeon]|nr:zinc ribbon domain-containing protein [Candidatus Heimdallarchaeota archaeon]